jgi:hypothetical protein
MFDVWDLVDAYDALARLRAALVHTILICLAVASLSDLMIALAPSWWIASGFAALVLAAATIALVQTANCASEIIRLEQLVTWMQGRRPRDPQQGGASCRAS